MNGAMMVLEALAENGVSIVTYAVLTTLDRDAPMTLSALAERVGTDRTTLSRTVERMRAALRRMAS